MATAARIAIRWYQYRRLLLDDYLLLFGCVCLCAGGGLLHRFLPVPYFFQRLNHDPESVRMSHYTIDDLLSAKKMLYAFFVLCWTSIFAVKLSFLSFFRTLIERISGGLITYWKIVLVSTIVSGAFNICAAFIPCPHFDLSAGMWQSEQYTLPASPGLIRS